MTIRAIIKTSNLVQLGLVLLLGVCFFWLGRDLREVNGLLHNFYRIDALLSELGGGAADKYRLALDYVSAPNESRLEEWQALLLAERGDVGRPSGSLLKGEGGRSLQEIANSLDLDKEERSLLQFCLEQNELLSRLTEIAVMRARGLFPDARGGFSIQGDPQPKQALQWVYDTKLARIPDKISNAGRQLRAHLYQDFLAHMSERKRALWWMLGLAVVGLGLLAVNVAAGMFVFHKRVVRPLGLVGRYAEDVAAGNDPAPLRLKYGDELAGMFGSLQKMKSALLLRIQELKTAETAAHASRKQALQARAQALSSLRIAQKASSVQEDFLRRISHEVRTPMNAIIGMTTIAMSRLDDRARLEDCLGKIAQSSRHLLGLINDVLDMSKIEGGRLSIAHEPFNFRLSLQGIVNLIQPQIQEQGQNFEVSLSEVDEEELNGDAMRLNQILINLLSNAVKFTPRGGSIRLDIRQVHKNRNNVRFRFIIRDTGIGMSEEFISRLYMPFEQATASTASKFGGTGLGMAITQNLVSLLGGMISVKSKEGRGTEFTVELPFGLSGRQTSRELSALDPLKVLVVDDDPGTCEHASLLLGRMGLRARWVLAGKEAVDLILRARECGDDYDVCLIDWQMPDMDGVETARRIRREVGPDTLIIIISAYDWSPIEREAREAGVNAFINKPFFASTLHDTLLSITRHAPAKAEVSVPNRREYDFSGRRILLVEDNEFNREVAKEFLEMTGAAVECAGDGREALEKFTSSEPGHYALILMDVQMPVMSGYEATRAIRASDHAEAETIHILAMTANAFSEDIAAAVAVGMNGHLAKPIDVAALYRLIASHLEG